MICGCIEHKINGKSAEQAFTDQNLATLARAACEGDVAEIEKMLKLGANPNGAGYLGGTPLFWAVNCENKTGIEALLKAGADPNLRIPGPNGPYSATYAAATMTNPAPLKILLQNKGDPNTFEGNTVYASALHKAFELGVDEGQWDNYYALLDAGADINRADDVGNTIATLAVSLGQFDKAIELLDRGYTHDLVDLGGFTSNGGSLGLLPKAAKDRDRLIELLEKRGVHFPVPGRMDRKKKV
jgi:hypothetical protein